MDEFAHAFGDADSLIVLDIYAAGEQPIPGLTGEILADRIKDGRGHEARYIASFAEAAAIVSALAEEGDMILTLGAGSVSQLGPTILEKLQARQPAKASSFGD